MPPSKVIEGPESQSDLLRHQPITTHFNAFPIENLSPELILNVLMSLSSFEDLARLIRASPDCYRLFTQYRRTIGVQVGKNIFGKSYKTVTTVLNYGRYNCTPAQDRLDYARFEALTGETFYFSQIDILRIRAIKICYYETLATLVNFKFTRDPSIPGGNPMIPLPSFSVAKTFSQDLFYLTLLVIQQYRFDSINNFIETMPNRKEEIDIYWVSRVMGVRLNSTRNITKEWGRFVDLGNFDELNGRPVLASKVKREFLKTLNGKKLQLMRTLIHSFVAEYKLGGREGSLKALIAKYKLDHTAHRD